MLKTLKRKIALVAVAAIGASGLALVAAPSANAAAGAAQTGTVTPVRVSFVGTTPDAVPASTLTFTNNGADPLVKSAANTATIVLSEAPTTAAEVSVTLPGTGTPIIKDTLGGNSTNVAASDTVLAANLAPAASLTVPIAITAAPAAGTYKGQIVINDGAGATVTVNFAFTTTGAPASYTLTQTSTSTLLQGVDTATLTLLDGAGKTTQPGAFDSFALTTTAGTFVDGVTGGNADATLSNTELRTGVASLTFTAANAASTTTVTATPGGILPGQGLAAKTLTYTVTGTILATALTAMTVSAPTNAVLVANVTTGNSNTAAVPAGTSAVTVGFTGTASSKYRFKLSGLAGTINGATATTAQFVNVDTDSAGKGSIALTLGGSALIEGAGTRVTVEQVTVANAAATNDVDIVITQTARAAGADTITLSPTGANIAKLGTATAPTSTPVTVTVADQFGTSVGAGYTVRAFRGSVANANLLATAVTAADGTASVTVSHATTLVAAGTETYVFTAIAPGVTSITATPTLVMSYSTDGNITGMTTTITGGGTTNLAAAAGTGVGATVATAQTTYSVIEVPADGTANDVTLDGIYTVSNAAVTKTNTANAYAVADGGEVLTLNTDANPNNAAVYTVSEGLFLCKTNSCAWNAGLTTATISDATDVFVFGTKTGIGTVTITSGGLTREVKVFVKNASTNFYSLSATPATATVAGGAYGVITVSVKDIFGNAVDTDANDIAVTAEGAVLLGGMAASTTTGTGAAGTATVTYIGNNTGGSGKVTVEGVPTTGAWATGFVKPTGAGDPVKSGSVTLTVTAASVTTDPLKADVATANAAVKALATQVTVLQASVATLIDSLTTQIASLMKSVSALTKAVAKLQAKK